MTLLHPILPTKFNLDDMNIGDAISCEYIATSGGKGQFYKLGEAEKPLIDPLGSATPDGSFFFIKVDNGTLIADRCVQHSITWNALNSYGYIDGTLASIYTKKADKFLVYNKTVNMLTDFNQFRDGVYTAYTSSSGYQGANITLLDNKYNLQASGIIEIEMDVYLTGFYSSPHVPNNFLYLINKNNDIITREQNHGVFQYGTATAMISNTVQNITQNQWNHYKYIIDFDSSIIQVYINDVLTTLTTAFGTYEIGDPLLIHMGVASCNYAATNRYKNITIKKQDGTIVNVDLSGITVDRDILIRSLSGGSCYIDQNGNPTLKQVDVELGAYPPNNEYDKYIKRSNLNKRIIPGDDNIWNYRNLYIMCRETPVLQTWTNYNNETSAKNNTHRILRGWEDRTNNNWKGISSDVATALYTVFGFRPVLIYKERYGKNTTLFY